MQVTLTAVTVRATAVSQLQQLLAILTRVFVTQPASQLDVHSRFFVFQLPILKPLFPNKPLYSPASLLRVQPTLPIS